MARSGAGHDIDDKYALAPSLHFQQQIGDQLRRYHRILGALSPSDEGGGALGTASREM